MLRDFFGQRFQEGDTIAYPVRQGSCLWIETAVILEIGEDILKIEKPNGNKTRIKNYQNCIIKPLDIYED